MNKRLAVIVAVIVALIGGGVAYLAMQGDGKSSRETAASESTATEATTDDDGVKSAGSYVEYSEAKLAETEGTKIIFFHAPWCPQCRTLEASIQSSTVPAGVTIFKADYDTNQALRQKYGVTLQTTLVKVDDQGELIEKFVAYGEPTFEAVKENLLQ